MVADYLSENFSSVVDTKFTSNMESNLDKISEGKLVFFDALDEFNKGLDSQIKKATTSSMPSAFVTDIKCTKCESDMVKKLSKHGPFLGCSSWPECDGTLSIDGKSKSSDSVETGHACPKCSNILILRNGKNGKFYGCKSYPACKYTATVGEGDIPVEVKKSKAKSTGVNCSKCKDGEMLERKGKYGKFYGCSKFPKCKNIMKTI